MSPHTLPQLLENSVKKYGRNILLWEKTGERYQGITYEQARERVHRFAAGLMSLGLRPGDRAALISEGRADWVVAELGILYCGGVNVPISVKIEELSELKFRLAHSGCRLAIVSAGPARRVLQIKNDLPELEKVIALDQGNFGDRDVLPLGELLSRGDAYLQQNRGLFERTWQAVREDSLANICYTSGTTADPKGIMLSHRNYTANVEQCGALMEIPEWYCSLLILPWDHAFAHTVGIYALLANGAALAAVQAGKTALETLKNIPGNIRETRPTFLLSVPALAQNFRRNIEKGIRQKGPLAWRLFEQALAVAYRYNGEGWNRGRGGRRLLKPLLALYDKILFSKIRENFGGRLEFFIGGGALLDIELQKFFYAIGIPMFQGYGLTEAAPVISANVPLGHKLGSSGKIVARLDVKICDEQGQQSPAGQKGEIVVRGENVMTGYWKNEKATAEALRGGWLHTGDLGYLDEDGYLYVLGRQKSLLISSDGEKFSPEGIEETIVAHSEFIEQIMLYNNQSPYTVALVVPNRDALLAYAREHRLALQQEADQKKLLRRMDADFAAFREGGDRAGLFPGKWLPSTFAVLGEKFTENNRLLNSTMKMVRGRICEFYRNRLDHLYTPEGKDICNRQNLTIIARLEEG